MTLYKRQYYNTKGLICRTDKTQRKFRCPGCEKTKRNTKFSKSHSSPQKTFYHIYQCDSFTLIPYPKRPDAVAALEEACLAIKNNTPLEETTAWKLGMII